MKVMMRLGAVVFVLLAGCSSGNKGVEGDTLDLRILETTDIHTTLMNYDYYQDKQNDSMGLVMTAALIKQAREEAQNTFMVDNGDLIQGTPMADYYARGGLEEGETHPVYKAMNLLDYDVGNIGNHEFNYGLEYLDRVIAKANFPYISSNVYHDDGDDDQKNDKPYFDPYAIVKKQYQTHDGKMVTLSIGVLGFVPPQIMNWDKMNLEGKVRPWDIVEAAEYYVPILKKKGADIILAVPHSGLGRPDYQELDENGTYALSLVEGIDAIAFGHSHAEFPSDKFKDFPGANIEEGTLNGVPSVMPGRWGDHLGVIDLTLSYTGGKWSITEGKGQVRAIYDRKEKKALVAPRKEVVEALAESHQVTLEYIRTAVATLEEPVYSYFAMIQDDPSVQLVSDAQQWYVSRYFEGTEYDDVPVLSAAAPFKFGGRYSADYYTDIPAGTIAIKNVADLYVYPNTVVAVLIKGQNVREWLERSAIIFNTIDPAKGDGQELLTTMPSYNFDVIDGVEYEIDLTQPPRYDSDGVLINEDARRIVNLSYQGAPLKDDQEFIVATNNYRAYGGGKFPGLDGGSVIFASPDETRQAIINYLIHKGSVNPQADNNWKFAPMGGRSVNFLSGEKAQNFLSEFPRVSHEMVDDEGFHVYRVLLD